MLEKIKDDINELNIVTEKLKAENFEKIDFDQLIIQLDKVQSLNKNYLHIQHEHQLLQNYFIQKISIMEKAIEVVSKKRPNIKELENSLQKLSLLNSDEIIQLFDKTENRFHSSFPSTFQIESYQKKKLKEYKSYK